MHIQMLTSALLFIALFAVGCQSSDEPAARRVPKSVPKAASGPAEKVPAADGLTAFELEHGIGPVNESLALGPVDEKLAAKGGEIFEMKCSACHRFDKRFVGPSMDGITEKRTPEYIVNMILNPDEMIKRHPVAMEQLREYLIPMTYQNVSKEEALAILDYLRKMDGQSK